MAQLLLLLLVGLLLLAKAAAIAQQAVAAYNDVHDIVYVGGGGFGAPEDGEAADYIEGDKGLDKAVADRAARWVKEHSAPVTTGGSVARYTSEQESA